MHRFVLGIAVTVFFGSASIASSHEGYCERGLYIPTHIIKCVTFCADHGKVFVISSVAPEALRRCECMDGNIKMIPPDTQKLQCPKPECGPECLRG